MARRVLIKCRLLEFWAECPSCRPGGARGIGRSRRRDAMQTPGVYLALGWGFLAVRRQPDRVIGILELVVSCLAWLFPQINLEAAAPPQTNFNGGPPLPKLPIAFPVASSATVRDNIAPPGLEVHGCLISWVYWMSPMTTTHATG